jgi:hypothetical protein
MINCRQRFTIEAVKPSQQDAEQRVYNFNEVSQPYIPEIAMEQAQCCLHAPRSGYSQASVQAGLVL